MNSNMLQALAALLKTHGTDSVLNALADACDASADNASSENGSRAFERAGDLLRKANCELDAERGAEVVTMLEVLGDSELAALYTDETADPTGGYARAEAGFADSRGE